LKAVAWANSSQLAIFKAGPQAILGQEFGLALAWLFFTSLAWLTAFHGFGLGQAQH